MGRSLIVIEFDIRVQDDGTCAVMRYANNSNYRSEGLIKKEGKGCVVVDWMIHTDIM